MMYIENIFICISIPLFLSLIFIRGDMRKYMLFICIGMGMCVLSAYVSSFFMGYYHTDAVVAAIEIVPVCEEVMKLLPLLFYLLIFEPERKGIPGAAVAADLTETLKKLQREGITEKIVTKYGLDADEILPEGEQNE